MGDREVYNVWEIERCIMYGRWEIEWCLRF